MAEFRDLKTERSFSPEDSYESDSELEGLCASDDFDLGYITPKKERTLKRIRRTKQVPQAAQF
jgi:hypothetical protein